jgi:hypothetical protein
LFHAVFIANLLSGRISSVKCWAGRDHLHPFGRQTTKTAMRTRRFTMDAATKVV